MGSYTPRLNLYKPAGNENVNVDQLNSNWDLVDASLGIANCTSATRPVSPPSGQLISESDTNKLSFWTGSSWKVIYDPKGIPALAAEVAGSVGALPSSGNWAGRRMYVTGVGEYVNPAGNATWVRTWSVGTPFAQAAGSGSNNAAAFGTINFPAGRFTVAPSLSFSIKSLPPGIMYVSSVTKDSASVGGLNSSGTAIATTFDWQAVQMTPTAAAG